MTWTVQDYHFMSLAIQLARRGRYTCDPNPRVGCVITRNNQIIAEGWHAVTGEAHAEVNALKSVDNVSGATVYLTLEPCSHHGRTPPCVDALIKAKVKEVIIAMMDPNPAVSGNGIEKLEDVGIAVKKGLLEAESRKLNPGFIKRMMTGKPYVRCKLAMSLDARTALSNGESQWISCPESRRDVHRLRAGSSAILTSVETVLKDDPLLTARDIDFEFKQPVRVIVDRKLKTSPTAKVFSQTGKVIIYTESDNTSGLEYADADMMTLPASDSWLSDVIMHLAKEYEVNEIVVEAGSTFSGALIEAELVDELIIYMAPVLLGHEANPLLKLKEFNQLSDAIQLELNDVRQIGKDLRLSYKLKTRQER